MNEVTTDARPLTSIELLDAAVWREIGSEEPQPQAAFGGPFGDRWALAPGAFERAGDRSRNSHVPLPRLYREARAGSGMQTLNCYRYALLNSAAPFIRIMKSAFKESGRGTPGKEQK